MDFINEMESDEVDIPMLDYEMVEATFFEKGKEYFVKLGVSIMTINKVRVHVP